MIQHGEVNAQRAQQFADDMSTYVGRLNDKQKIDFFIGNKIASNNRRITKAESDKASQLQEEFLTPKINMGYGGESLDDETAKRRFQSMLKEQYKAFVEVGKNYETSFAGLPEDTPDRDQVAAYHATQSKDAIIAKAWDFSKFRSGNADTLAYAVLQGKENFSEIADEWEKEAEKEFRDSLSTEDRERFDIGKDLNQRKPTLLTKTIGKLGIRDELIAERRNNLRSIYNSIDTNYRDEATFFNAHKYVLDGTDESAARKISDQYNSLDTAEAKMKFIEDLAVMDSAGNLSEAEAAQMDSCIRDFFNPVDANGQPDFQEFQNRVAMSHQRRRDLRFQAVSELEDRARENNLDLDHMDQNEKNRLMIDVASKSDAFNREQLHDRVFALENMGQGLIGNEYKEAFIRDSNYTGMPEEDVNERFVGAWRWQFENAKYFNGDMDEELGDKIDLSDEMSEAFGSRHEILDEAAMTRHNAQHQANLKGFARDAELGKSFRDSSVHVNMEMLEQMSQAYTDMSAADKWNHFNSRRYDDLIASLKRVHDKYEYYHQRGLDLTEAEKTQLMADLEDVQQKNETYYNSKVGLSKKSDLDTQREGISKNIRSILNPPPEKVAEAQEERAAAERAKAFEEAALEEELETLDDEPEKEAVDQDEKPEEEAVDQDEKPEKEAVDQDEKPEEDTQEQDKEKEIENEIDDFEVVDKDAIEKEIENEIDDFEVVDKDAIEKEIEDETDDFEVVDKDAIEKEIEDEIDDFEKIDKDSLKDNAELKKEEAKPEDEAEEEVEKINEGQETQQKPDEEPQKGQTAPQTNQAQQTAPQTQKGQTAPQTKQTQQAAQPGGTGGFQVQSQGSVTLGPQSANTATTRPNLPSRNTALSRVPVSPEMNSIMADYSRQARQLLNNIKEMNPQGKDREELQPLVQSLQKLATISGKENLQQMDDLLAEISQNARDAKINPFDLEEIENIPDMRGDFRKQINRSFNSGLDRLNRNENRLRNSKNNYIRIYNDLQKIDATGADKEIIDQLSAEIDKLSDRDNHDLNSMMESGNRINQIALDYNGTNPDIQRLCMDCVEANSRMTKNLASYRQAEFDERQRDQQFQKQADEYYRTNGNEVPVFTDTNTMTQEQPAVTEEKPAATEEKPAATEEKPAVNEEQPKATQEQPDLSEDKSNINLQAEQAKNEALDIEDAEPEKAPVTEQQSKKSTEAQKPEEKKPEEKKPEDKKGTQKEEADDDELDFSSGPVTAESLQNTQAFKDFAKGISELVAKQKEKSLAQQTQANSGEKPLIQEIPVAKKPVSQKNVEQPKPAPVTEEAKKTAPATGQAKKTAPATGQAKKTAPTTETAKKPAANTTQAVQPKQTIQKKAQPTAKKVEPAKSTEAAKPVTTETNPKTKKAASKKVTNPTVTQTAAPKKPAEQKPSTESPKKLTKFQAQRLAEKQKREARRIANDNILDAKRRLIEEIKASKTKKALPIKKSKTQYANEYKKIMLALKGAQETHDVKVQLMEIVKNKDTDTPDKVSERLANLDETLAKTRSQNPEVNKKLDQIKKLSDEHKQDCRKANYYLRGEKQIVM